MATHALVCVATAVLWVRSFRTTSCLIYFMRPTPGNNGFRQHSVNFGIRIARSGYRFYWRSVDWQEFVPTFSGFEIHSYPPSATDNLPSPDQNNGSFLGVGGGKIDFDDFLALTTEHYVITPLWLILILSLLSELFWLRHLLRKRHRQRLGHCLRCGYDLRATPGRCPECGIVPTKNAQA